ncbi:uncharacterized protein LOC118736123 [Rhagoletis pomonella]|uniref:uncharacterized protein LOC118736123 n=1 Tax=Rhagoletis pomonella TaxID=28610 RepID=UPI001783F947|nr:uncharacterized protein LOC118736123 [Rhagoletis pomonella]
MFSKPPNLLPMEQKQNISLPENLTIEQQQHQHYALKWSEFQSSILNCFQRLRDEEDFVDVTLTCDEKSFTAHRVVLSACSPYFRKLLKSNPCKHPIVILKDVRSENLECILSFMYNGEVNLRHDQLPEFLKTANLLQIRGLTDVSESLNSSGFISLATNKRSFDRDASKEDPAEKCSFIPKYKPTSERPYISTLEANYSNNNNNNLPPMKETKTSTTFSVLLWTFRSAKNLLSKFKNIKAGLRKGYAASKLSRQLTGGGKPPPDIDQQLSGNKQDLHAAIALTIEGLVPNFDDNDEAQFATADSEPYFETRPDNVDASNDTTELFLDIIQMTDEENDPQNTRTINLSEMQSTSRVNLPETQNKSSVNTSEAHSANLKTDSNNNSSDKQESEIQSHPTHALIRKNKKTRRMAIAQSNPANDNAKCAVIAKAAFFQNEEKRDSERHELQMQLWRAEREEKSTVHEICLEEHRLRIELLTAQIESVKRKRTNFSENEI